MKQFLKLENYYEEYEELNPTTDKQIKDYPKSVISIEKKQYRSKANELFRLNDEYRSFNCNKLFRLLVKCINEELNYFIRNEIVLMFAFKKNAFKQEIHEFSKILEKNNINSGLRLIEEPKLKKITVPKVKTLTNSQLTNFATFVDKNQIPKVVKFRTRLKNKLLERLSVAEKIVLDNHGFDMSGEFLEYFLEENTHAFKLIWNSKKSIQSESLQKAIQRYRNKSSRTIKS